MQNKEQDQANIEIILTQNQALVLFSTVAQLNKKV